jgi:hypothetical protein
VYREAVDVLTGLSIMEGRGAKDFDPKTGLNRAELAKLATYAALGPDRAQEYEDASKFAPPFSDLTEGFWANGYITFCKQNNIVAGVGNNKFEPTGSVTFYHAFRILSSILGYGAKGEFEGANWKIGVADAARQAELNIGLEATLANAFNLARSNQINYDKAINREEIAKVFLNALLALMRVYIPGQDVYAWRDMAGAPIYNPTDMNQDALRLIQYINCNHYSAPVSWHNTRGLVISNVAVDAPYSEYGNTGWVYLNEDGKVIAGPYFTKPTAVKTGLASTGTTTVNQYRELFVNSLSSNYINRVASDATLYINGAGPFRDYSNNPGDYKTDEIADNINKFVKPGVTVKAYVRNGMIRNIIVLVPVSAVVTNVPTVSNNVIDIRGILPATAQVDARKLVGYENLKAGDVFLFYPMYYGPRDFYPKDPIGLDLVRGYFEAITPIAGTKTRTNYNNSHVEVSMVFNGATHAESQVIVATNEFFGLASVGITLGTSNRTNAWGLTQNNDPGKIWCDPFGNVIHSAPDAVTVPNYAWVIVANQDNSNPAIPVNRATMLLPDGTILNNVLTAANYSGAGTDPNAFVATGRWAEYSVSNGVYTLKAAANIDNSATVGAGQTSNIHRVGNVTFASNHTSPSFTLTPAVGSTVNVTTNNSTTFVVYRQGTTRTWVYTGINNLPKRAYDLGTVNSVHALVRAGSSFAQYVVLQINDDTTVSDNLVFVPAVGGYYTDGVVPARFYNGFLLGGEVSIASVGVNNNVNINGTPDAIASLAPGLYKATFTNNNISALAGYGYFKSFVVGGGTIIVSNPEVVGTDPVGTVAANEYSITDANIQFYYFRANSAAAGGGYTYDPSYTIGDLEALGSGNLARLYIVFIPNTTNISAIYMMDN